MFKFKEILQLPIQFVFVTGTFLLYLEESFKEEFLIKDLTIIRGCTTRSNISYQARLYKSTREEEQFLEVRNFIEVFFSTFTNIQDKILIFCPSTTKVIKLGKFLDCSIYYSSLENKENILKSYLNNTDSYNQIIVSTSGLEEGIDYPCIRLVIYIDYIYSFIGFLQGSSRGGRDSKNSTSIFFYTESSLENQLDKSQDRLFISKYLREQVCRRRIIDLYLDNTITDQCSVGISKCDLCLKRSTITNSTITSLLDSNKEVQATKNWYIDIIVNLQSNCLLCLLVKNSSLSKEHVTKNCTTVDIGKPFRQFISRYRNSIKPRLIADTCCFTCFLPTIICSSLKQANSRCLDNLLISKFFCICLLFFDKLDLYNSFNLDFNYKVDFDSLQKIFFSKVYIKDINTEAILGIEVFYKLLQLQADKLE